MLVTVWRLSSGGKVATFYVFDDGDWLFLTTQGYFIASDEGAGKLSVIEGDTVHSIDQYLDTYNRPAMVERIFKE